MLILTNFLGGYIIVAFISLLIMHRFKKQLDIDSYDPPHDEWHDDWDSNAQAYVWFSLMWPIWWGLMGLFGIMTLLNNFSRWIGNQFSKK
jgi:hypothetical protein